MKLVKYNLQSKHARTLHDVMKIGVGDQEEHAMRKSPSGHGTPHMKRLRSEPNTACQVKTLAKKSTDFEENFERRFMNKEYPHDINSISTISLLKQNGKKH